MEAVTGEYMTSMDEDATCKATDATSDNEATSVKIEDPTTKAEDENQFGGPTFYPPLYIQRYTFVKGILDELQPESVVDFGSAECGIFRHLKEVVTLLRVSLVDLDSSLLEVNKHRIRPQCYDYLQKRKNPLSVQILEGNATMCDNRLTDYQAVTMVEFIEHLYEEDLQKVIKMVFECINPKFVIMTTPNYEFNQLFPGPRKFRHFDHKFEWTRTQFQNWCNGICGKYSYSSIFYGIGNGPLDSEHLGCCSQAAVLTRQGERHKFVSDILHQSYTLAAESSYPHCEVIISKPEEILESEVSYVLSFMCRCNDYHDDEDTYAWIPLDKILSFKSVKCLCDLNQLRDFLKKKNYTLSKNEDNVDCVCVEIYSEDTRGLLYGDEDFSEAENYTKEEMLTGESTQHRITDILESWD